MDVAGLASSSAGKNEKARGPRASEVSVFLVCGSPPGLGLPGIFPCESAEKGGSPREKERHQFEVLKVMSLIQGAIFRGVRARTNEAEAEDTTFGGILAPLT